MSSLKVAKKVGNAQSNKKEEKSSSMSLKKKKTSTKSLKSLKKFLNDPSLQKPHNDQETKKLCTPCTKSVRTLGENIKTKGDESKHTKKEEKVQLTKTKSLKKPLKEQEVIKIHKNGEKITSCTSCSKGDDTLLENIKKDKHGKCNPCKSKCSCPCRCKRGPRGKTGATGPRGARGATGATGVVGAAEYNRLIAQPATVAPGTAFTIDNLVLNTVPTAIVASAGEGGTVFTLSPGLYTLDYEMSLEGKAAIAVYKGPAVGSLAVDNDSIAGSTTSTTWVHGRHFELVGPDPLVIMISSVGATPAVPVAGSSDVYMVRLTILKLS